MLVKQKAGMHPTTDVTCSREKLVRTHTLCEHENICFTSLEPVGPCNSYGKTESVCVCVCQCWKHNYQHTTHCKKKMQL